MLLIKLIKNKTETIYIKITLVIIISLLHKLKNKKDF
jgi:hypothetical protein